jgi:hypothetical protein
VHALVDLFGNGHRDIVSINFSGGGDLFYRQLQLGKPIRWRSGRRVGVTRLTRFVETTATPGAAYAVRALNGAGKSDFSAPGTAPAG